MRWVWIFPFLQELRFKGVKRADEQVVESGFKSTSIWVPNQGICRKACGLFPSIILSSSFLLGLRQIHVHLPLRGASLGPTVCSGVWMACYHLQPRGPSVHRTRSAGGWFSGWAWEGFVSLWTLGKLRQTLGSFKYSDELPRKWLGHTCF